MNNKLTIKEMVVFALLGAIMFVSKLLFEFLPNIHMLGMLTMVYSLVYRKKGIIPVAIFVLLEGVYSGFAVWWVPYVYLWPLLWLVTLLLPKRMPNKIAIPVYMTVCAMHGLCYGTLYAPFQAIVFRYSFKTTLAWIASGFPWDCIHALGNLGMGMLIVPLVNLLKRLEGQPYHIVNN